MLDLKLAEERLYTCELTLVIVKNGEVFFETDSHRISGFIKAIEQLGPQLREASVADRVAGKALALLCVYAGVRDIYAEVLSRKAQAVFEKNHISMEWRHLVDNVLDLNKSGVCPFEQVAAGLSDPAESFEVFKALLEKMRACKQ